MGLNISVCRKKDDVYLKLMGKFSNASAYELLRVMKKVMMAALKFSSPGATVLFTFRTHAKVDLGKRGGLLANSQRDRTGRPLPGKRTLSPKKSRDLFLAL
jgi:hypothetical protein